MMRKMRIQIILHMRKVPSEHLLSIYILCEGLHETVRTRIWAYAIRICPKTRFRIARPI